MTDGCCARSRTQVDIIAPTGRVSERETISWHRSHVDAAAPSGVALEINCQVTARSQRCLREARPDRGVPIVHRVRAFESGLRRASLGPWCRRHGGSPSRFEHRPVEELRRARRRRTFRVNISTRLKWPKSTVVLRGNGDIRQDSTRDDLLKS